MGSTTEAKLDTACWVVRQSTDVEQVTVHRDTGGGLALRGTWTLQLRKGDHVVGRVITDEAAVGLTIEALARMLLDDWDRSRPPATLDAEAAQLLKDVLDEANRKQPKPDTSWIPAMPGPPQAT